MKQNITRRQFLKNGALGLVAVNALGFLPYEKVFAADKTAADVDNEVMELLKGAYEKAKAQITEHKDKLLEIADFLISKETITGAEFMKIFKGEQEEAKKEDDPESKETENAEPAADINEPSKDTENV